MRRVGQPPSLRRGDEATTPSETVAARACDKGLVMNDEELHAIYVLYIYRYVAQEWEKELHVNREAPLPSRIGSNPVLYDTKDKLNK